MNPIINKIRTELQANYDIATQVSFQRFFKEEVKYYGVKTGTVSKIADKYWRDIKYRPKDAIFALCEDLLKSDYTEEAFIVASWVPKLTSQFKETDLALFRRWIECYLNNWAKCDAFCNHSVGNFIEKYPPMVIDLESWANSSNRWLKRASAVSLVVPAKRGYFLENVFRISDVLLIDKDAMVQKGYGWLLKEASRSHQIDVFNYVIKHKNVMPRTALRYAIELMSAELKAAAMKKQEEDSKFL